MLIPNIFKFRHVLAQAFALAHPMAFKIPIVILVQLSVFSVNLRGRAPELAGSSQSALGKKQRPSLGSCGVVAEDGNEE